MPEADLIKQLLDSGVTVAGAWFIIKYFMAQIERKDAEMLKLVESFQKAVDQISLRSSDALDAIRSEVRELINQSDRKT